MRDNRSHCRQDNVGFSETFVSVFSCCVKLMVALDAVMVGVTKKLIRKYMKQFRTQVMNKDFCPM